MILKSIAASRAIWMRFTRIVHVVAAMKAGFAFIPKNYLFTTNTAVIARDLHYCDFAPSGI